MEQYSFQVPRRKTAKVFYHGAIGGKCPQPCKNCMAFDLCGGCDNLCPDRLCPGTQCHRCPCFCNRVGERLEKVLTAIDGLEIDLSEQDDRPFDFDIQKVRYIPAITRPLREKTDYPVISIPFYALWNFQTDNPLIRELHQFFRLDEDTQIIGNFYFKDDKIIYLFDRMMEGRFLDMLRLFPEVDYWHTPCFSVFTQGNGMDTLLNFKRQFWIGDRMRTAGFNVIQEVLYSLKPRVKARIPEALEIIRKKKIRKISQNCQLVYDFGKAIVEERNFVKGLPPDVFWLQTGLSNKEAETYYHLHWGQNMIFCNYTGEFQHRKEWNEYVKNINNEFCNLYEKI